MEARDRRGFWCAAKVLEALTRTQHLSLTQAWPQALPKPGQVLETPPPVAGEPRELLVHFLGWKSR